MPETLTMSKNTAFSLGEHVSSFVESRVGKDRHSGTGEVVRTTSRQLEEPEPRLEALRAALIEGEQSGPSRPFDFEAFITSKRGSPPSEP